MSSVVELLTQIAENTKPDNQAVWVAAISSVSALLGAGIGALLLYKGTSRQVESQKETEEKKLKVNVVTTERLRWLQEIRSRSSEFYANLDMNYSLLKPLGLFGGLSDAPFFTRNAEYIQQNVRDPTDLIVLDHSKLDQDLLKDGVDPMAYWNLWRLTPEIYRTPDEQWVVKEDFGKLDAEFLADKIEYIFSTAVDVVLGLHTARKSVKSGGHGRYFLELRREEVPVFESADNTSRVVATSPPGLVCIDTDYRVLGLKSDAIYWHVSHFGDGYHLWGYIHADDVKVG